MTTCPACGKENPEGFQFCGFCTAPLTESPAASVHEERKVVSVLFCDLVGFTAASEGADPEDVRSRIRPYHATVRDLIEGYGGTVEKFVGDAVMAVFGAPAVHEDDAERAVRAGLRILEAIEELNEAEATLSLEVRIGINTGEVVVDRRARPERGEGIVTGDVVNTASRLQGAAPVNAIAVSEATYRATELIFDYEELESAQVKGKAEPLALYRPLAPRARFGTDLTRTHATPLVGRELEKSLLIGAFERSAQQRSCQLVTVVGEPGVGKSRLCAELFAHIEERQGLTRWRQGRCLPYGEGIAFWALGEIVKAECGILESDSPGEAEAKLELRLPADDPDFAWLKARLAPLIGAGGEPASQEESFTAWRRVLESWAEARESVLVFEDLHWADASLLAFLEHLADWAQGVPLLVLCTARPELYERHPTWAAGLRNAHTTTLPPLSEEETARLIAALLERAVLPAETQRALLERAGGNPLFAEEFVRLLQDRGELAEAEEVPDSVQALIAARLDTLSDERKSLLQDAAVMGKVFWAAALAEMGDRDPGEVERALHELTHKELVRVSRSSSMEGEAEYGFWHVLVRDVCYGQIPRAAKAARHRASAEWIERKAGDRAEDLADVLAHHYVTALELARASGQTSDVDALEAAAIRNLALSGERALALDVATAEASFEKALALAPAGHAERALLLERWAEAAQQLHRLQEAKDALEEALALYREQGEDIAAGRALTELSGVVGRLGDPRTEETMTEALALLEAHPPGPVLVVAYAQLARRRMLRSDYPEAVAVAEQSLHLAAELSLPEPPYAVGVRGAARSCLGDRQGLEDLRRGLALAVEQGEGRTAAVQHNNLALAIWVYDGPRAALAACSDGFEFCERRGIAEMVLGIAAMKPTFLAELGQVEQALVEAGSMADRLQTSSDIMFTEPRALQLRLLAERGAHGQAPSADELVTAAREIDEAQGCAQAYGAAAQLWLAQGRPQGAPALLVELEQFPNTRSDPYYVALLPGVVRTALALREPEVAARLTEDVLPNIPLYGHALCSSRAALVEAEGDHAGAAVLYAEAAERWHEFGNVPERAYALLGQGRCLAAIGGRGAEPPLREAHELFASMGYQPALAETRTLLAGSAAAAS